MSVRDGFEPTPALDYGRVTRDVIAQKIATALGARRHAWERSFFFFFLKISYVYFLFGGSALTAEIAVQKGRSGEEGDFPSLRSPRNTIFPVTPGLGGGVDMRDISSGECIDYRAITMAPEVITAFENGRTRTKSGNEGANCTFTRHSLYVEGGNFVKQTNSASILGHA